MNRTARSVADVLKNVPVSQINSQDKNGTVDEKADHTDNKESDNVTEFDNTDDQNANNTANTEMDNTPDKSEATNPNEVEQEEYDSKQADDLLERLSKMRVNNSYTKRSTKRNTQPNPTNRYNRHTRVESANDYDDTLVDEHDTNQLNDHEEDQDDNYDEQNHQEDDEQDDEYDRYNTHQVTKNSRKNDRSYHSAHQSSRPTSVYRQHAVDTDTFNELDDDSEDVMQSYSNNHTSQHMRDQMMPRVTTRSARVQPIQPNQPNRSRTNNIRDIRSSPQRGNKNIRSFNQQSQRTQQSQQLQQSHRVQQLQQSQQAQQAQRTQQSQQSLRHMPAMPRSSRNKTRNQVSQQSQQSVPARNQIQHQMNNQQLHDRDEQDIENEVENTETTDTQLNNVSCVALSKIAIIRIAKVIGIPSLSSDVYDSIRSLVGSFILSILDECAHQYNDNSVISYNELEPIIERYLGRQVEDMEQSYMNVSIFSKWLKPIIAQYRLVLKNECIMFVHNATEFYILCLLTNARDVATRSRRSRITSGDCELASRMR